MINDEERQQAAAQEATPPPSAEVLEWPSPGTRLRKMREEQQLSHADVAERMHLTRHYIKSLEQDQYEKLPSRVFIKGYIRSYAILLGADPLELVTSYERFSAVLDAQEAERNPRSRESLAARRQRKRRNQTRAWLIGAALLLLAFVSLSWWFAGRDDVAVNAVPNSQFGTFHSLAEEIDRSQPLAVERLIAEGKIDQAALGFTAEPLEIGSVSRSDNSARSVLER